MNQDFAEMINDLVQDHRLPSYFLSFLDTRSEIEIKKAADSFDPTLIKGYNPDKERSPTADRGKWEDLCKKGVLAGKLSRTYVSESSLYSTASLQAACLSAGLVEACGCMVPTRESPP